MSQAPTRISVAPMVGVTNLYHRYLCRLLSKRVTLYTEMVVAETLHFGKPELVQSMLNACATEPVVLQLAGRDKHMLQHAAKLAQSTGAFTEINYNCGCPSKKAAVGGAFGAQMMKEPELVAEIVQSIKQVSTLPITIKMRLGVDNLDTYEYVSQFVHTLVLAGADRFIVHARKAILGLDTKKNRSVPPLKYDWVERLCLDFPQIDFELNGGINTLEQAKSLVQSNAGIKGVMLGRAVWKDPLLLCEIDSQWFGDAEQRITRRQILEQYMNRFDDANMTLVEMGEPIEALQGFLHGIHGASAFRKTVHAKRMQGCRSLKEILTCAMQSLPAAVLDADICDERRSSTVVVVVGQRSSGFE